MLDIYLMVTVWRAGLLAGWVALLYPNISLLPTAQVTGDCYDSVEEEGKNISTHKRRHAHKHVMFITLSSSHRISPRTAS